MELSVIGRVARICGASARRASAPGLPWSAIWIVPTVRLIIIVRALAPYGGARALE
jgi:hypothetical protein